MKKIYSLFIALFALVGMANALTYNVTVPAGTHTCYIVGENVGWNNFTEMTKVDDTHYTITLADATNAQGYKYCSGPDWAYVEKDANGAEIGNRSYAANDVVAKWASVYAPGAAITYVTFEVWINFGNEAPTIWWWGAGSKCPNAENQSYSWPGPQMEPAGVAGWYKWTFTDVQSDLGVHVKIAGDAIGEQTFYDKVCLDASGAQTDCPSTEPTQPGTDPNQPGTDPNNPNVDPESTMYYLSGYIDGVDVNNVAVSSDGTFEYSFAQESYVFILEQPVGVAGVEYFTADWQGTDKRQCTLYTMAALTAMGKPNNKFYVPAGTTKLYYAKNSDGTMTISLDPLGTAVENVRTTSPATKTVVNGQLIITRNGVRYNATGARVK